MTAAMRDWGSAVTLPLAPRLRPTTPRASRCGPSDCWTGHGWARLRDPARYSTLGVAGTRNGREAERKAGLRGSGSGSWRWWWVLSPRAGLRACCACSCSSCSPSPPSSPSSRKFSTTVVRFVSRSRSDVSKFQAL